MWLVAPSRYVKQMAEGSYLASSWPVTVIPNPLDVDVFKPLDGGARLKARIEFGLPPEAPLILFGSGSRSAYTKGIDLLVQSLQVTHDRLPTTAFATFGPVDDALPGWVTQLGYIHDEQLLADLYASSDVVIVSSRFETFSQVASEAQACGTPVAAFATSGLLDVVDDGVTGFLADPYDPVSLADAVCRVIEAGSAMRHAARERAERLWAMPVVGRQYADWYEQAIGEFHALQRTK
jgi:glycosyltransferase involved in cell wall biosynthesis